MAYGLSGGDLSKFFTYFLLGTQVHYLSEMLTMLVGIVPVECLLRKKVGDDTSKSNFSSLCTGLH